MNPKGPPRGPLRFSEPASGRDRAPAWLTLPCRRPPSRPAILYLVASSAAVDFPQMSAFADRTAGCTMHANHKNLGAVIQSLRVLIVDDEHYMRKVIRSLLVAIGVKNIYEANDGPSGLDAIRSITPDLVLLDFNMPGMSGADFVRAVRSPETFPLPHVPIIMLTGNSDRSLVVEAVRLGVNEYLLKPVSTQALQARVLSIVTNPRKMIKRGDYYGPEPRKLFCDTPDKAPAEAVVI